MRAARDLSLWARRAVSHRLLLRRGFAVTPSRSQQHLLWSGVLLDKTTSHHEPLSQDLFLAAGAGDDFGAADVTLLAPSSSPTRGHSLLPYRTSAEQSGLSRILAVGRNTYSQLGVGFASQEATFGLVGPGFQGDGGIKAVLAAQGASWIYTLAASPTGQLAKIFACGNNTLGQLGLPTTTTSDSPPILDLVSAPRAVVDREDRHILSLATGLDHTLIIQSITQGNAHLVQVCSTGLNADGQLGRRLRSQDPDAPLPPLIDNSFSPVLQETYTIDEDMPRWQVAAGGDTSFAWTSSQGKLHRAWAWGNNEYQQCLLPMDRVGDQVSEPLDLSQHLKTIIGPDRDIQQVLIGGSWIAILDDLGRLFTAGFGATGRHLAEDGHPLPLGQVGELPALSLIAANNDAIMVVSKCRRRIFVWGIDADQSILGMGRDAMQNDIRRVQLPVEIPVDRWTGEQGAVEAIALGGDHSWILVEDGQDPKDVWKGSDTLNV